MIFTSPKLHVYVPKDNLTKIVANPLNPSQTGTLKDIWGYYLNSFDGPIEYEVNFLEEFIE